MPIFAPAPTPIRAPDRSPVNAVPGPLPRATFNLPHSGYGKAIPVAMGARRMEGQYLWASEPYYFEEVKRVDCLVSFGYNADLDMSATNAARLWARGAEIYNDTNTMPGDYTVTWYLGDQTSADPLYAAAVGEANAPAYTGQLVASFEGLPLQPFDHELPGISAGPSDIIPITGDLSAIVVRFTGETHPEWGFQELRGRVLVTESPPDSGIFFDYGANASFASTNESPPYVFTMGTTEGVDGFQSTPLAFYIDVDAIRADFPEIENLRLEISTSIHGTTTEPGYPSDINLTELDIGWTVEYYTGSPDITWTDSDYTVDGGSLVETESGTHSYIPGTNTPVVHTRDPYPIATTEPTEVDPVLISDFIKMAAERAGLDPDVDLSFEAGLDDTVEGALLDERVAFADLVLRVCRYAGWSVYAADTIRFLKPETPADADIDQDDLLFEGDRSLTVTRSEENKAAVQLALSYFNQERDFVRDERRARRVIYPTRTTLSRRRDAFAVPFVIPADEALERIATVMFREAVEKTTSLRFQLSPKYLKLEPGDVVTIEFEQGAVTTTWTLKITQVEIGPDFSLGIEAVPLWSEGLLDAVATVTGDLDATEGADTADMTGTVSGGTITGTLAATEGADTAALSGMVGNVITGTLAATEGADTASASGLVIVTGTLAATEGADSAALTGAVSTITTLNPSDMAANITLSIDKLTATAATGPARKVARSTTSKTTGKWVFAFDPSAITPSVGEFAVGVANTTASLTSYLGANTHSIGWEDNGQVWFNNFQPVSGTAYTAAASECMIAVDLDNKRVWVRSGSGLWNNSGTANPATNTGGASISAMTGPYFAAVQLYASGDSLTMNFGATAFANTVPSGFTAWNG